MPEREFPRLVPPESREGGGPAEGVARALEQSAVAVPESREAALQERAAMRFPEERQCVAADSDYAATAARVRTRERGAAACEPASRRSATRIPPARSLSGALSAREFDIGVRRTRCCLRKAEAECGSTADFTGKLDFTILQLN